MDTQLSVETLHPLEQRILAAVDDEQFDVERCMQVLSEKPEQAHQVISWLHDRGYAEVAAHRVSVEYELTERGRQSLRDGLIEERMLKLIRTAGMHISQLAATLAIEPAEAGSAVGKLIQSGAVRIDEHKRLTAHDGGGDSGKASEAGAKGAGNVAGAAALPPFIRMTAALLQRAAQAPLVRDTLSAAEQELIDTIAKKRGSKQTLFKITERAHNRYRWSKQGRRARRALTARGADRETVSALTAEMLQKGTWRGKHFRKFNIDIPPSRVLLGRTSTYSQFLRDIKDTLVAFGFSEFDGPLVETEFWNCDALFMPQFHSARDTHDVYHVQSPTHAREIDSRYVDPVAETHENGGQSGSSGWKYTFDRQFTKRLILRGQGTALSARQLRNARVPGKYFGVVRCFRYDQIDSTHLSDFYQTEGIVLGADVNLRTLLGLLRTFATEIGGAEEIRFAPGYFPFTEPSIEVFVKHPQLGWFELGGAGIFRPEVTTPFGIEVPVLAWGLGVDRMALLKLNLNDLRQLFSQDIDQIRLQTE